MRAFAPLAVLPLAFAAAAAAQADAPLPPPAAQPVDFARDVAPLLQRHCVACHGEKKQKGGLRLDRRADALRGGDEHAPAIRPGDSANSPLIRFVARLDADLAMPPAEEGEPLDAAAVGVLRRWIDDGAVWPVDAAAPAADDDPLAWWSLQPIRKPAVPRGDGLPAHPVDAFVQQRLRAAGLQPTPSADDATLVRRLHVDLLGLLPEPERLAAYLADARPDRYERLVDELLASPHHGERMARHWLDVVHYADTHGYDKDQPRPHAWPYRDYVVRARNADMPHARFVQQQIAGDALFPGERDGVEALGFLAAGPWDLIGHTEVREDKIDGMVARHMDRDDMVGNALGALASVTVQCAQCHDHKFDPIPQRDYYALQAVFAAIDRTEVAYDRDAATAARRAELQRERRRLADAQQRREDELRRRGGAELAAAEAALAAAEQAAADVRPDEHGWHSSLASDADAPAWAQVDLGATTAFAAVELRACWDDFAGIGKGFGFPVRYRIEACDEPTFAAGVRVLAARDEADAPNPGLAPVSVATPDTAARYVRITVARRAKRAEVYIAALAELRVLAADGRDLARGAVVTSDDEVVLGARWRRSNLTDGKWPTAGAVDAAAAAAARTQRDRVRAGLLDDGEARAQAADVQALAIVDRALAALPPPDKAYVGAVHTGDGPFAGTGRQGGAPRRIRLLHRGQVTMPREDVGPGALTALARALPAGLDLAADAPEAARRAALARWLTDPRQPLLWRSITNRLWQIAFGRGLVDTPDDFGRMGGKPSHPELLDWLAATFRDDLDGSWKRLLRLFVTSATYRQASTTNEAAAAIDAGNTLLWRGWRRRLDAETVRDAALQVAGSLDRTMGGPGWRDFVVEHPEHSPHYRYDLADPWDRSTWRRAIYRFTVRSQPQPFLAAFDCADPSQRVGRRNEGVTAAQALALRNSGFTLAQSRQFAARVAREAGADDGARIARAVQLAFGRAPTDDEAASFRAFVGAHGLPAFCRLLLQCNEFLFVD